MADQIEIEKGPGHDWCARYRYDDGFEDTISIFGVLTMEKAVEEARYSLEGFKDADGKSCAVMPYDLLAVWRADFEMAPDARTATD